MLDISALQSKVSTITSLTELEQVYIEIFGKQGLINTQAKTIASLNAEERKSFGQQLNTYKTKATELFAEKRAALQHEDRAAQVRFDTTLPGVAPSQGHLHPTTLLIREIYAYMRYLGYSMYDGPEIETDEFNFNKLNLPIDHPAREMQDTLYIAEPDVMLRTHTSSVETRCMTEQKPPIRIIVPGKCYRNESVNASNNAVFYQLEGLCIDTQVHMGHLKATLEGLAKLLYGQDVATRFRCKYYPQVEPGAGMDIRCRLCMGEGCAVCKYRGWIEVLGAGMVHPNALRACGIDPQKWSGFAFGIGLDRLVMMRYGITDIRQLYNGELTWK